MGQISLAEAKAHLSELINRVEAGEAIEITKRGKVVARLTAASPPRKPIDIEMLRKLTESMPKSPGNAGEFIRWMRDTDRY